MSTSTILRTRPGRVVITTTLSARNTASSTSWVMKNTVFGVRVVELEQILLHDALGQRVERAETVRRAAGPSGRSSARARSRRGASCRRTVRRDTGFSMPRRPTRPSSCVACVSASRATHLALLDRAAGDVPEHGLPGEQRAVLKHHHAVGAGHAAACRAGVSSSAVEIDFAGWSARRSRRWH